MLGAGDAHAGRWVALASGGSEGPGRECSQAGRWIGFFWLRYVGTGDRGGRISKNTKERSPTVQEALPCLVPTHGRRAPWGAGTVRTRWLLTGFLFYIKNTWF